MSINGYHAILHQAFSSDLIAQFDANYGQSVLAGHHTTHFIGTVRAGSNYLNP